MSLSETSARDRVRIVEVGPRDGLQNEDVPVSVGDRVELIERLATAGLGTVEAGSFVSPKWVPQMKSSDEVFQKITRTPGVRFSALTPNIKGFEAARKADVDEVAVFGAASESFSQKNINCSIDESLERFRPVTDRALELGMPVRGYLSCAVDCPYEGAIDPTAAAEVTRRLIEMGCYEVALSDTTGKGTPGSVSRLLDIVLDRVPVDRLALHCHDTYGQALANVYAAYQRGIRVFDGSVAGLGGCPYAKGASGNVATEDLLFLMAGLGVETGVDLDRVVEAGEFITEVLGCPNRSRVAVARRESR